MMPPARAILDACRFISRRHPSMVLPEHDDLIEALVDARTEAQRLADGSGDDLASYFFAHARESARLGAVTIEAVIVITIEQTKQQRGRTEIVYAADILRRHARDIARGALGFDEWFAWWDERFSAD